MGKEFYYQIPQNSELHNPEGRESQDGAWELGGNQDQGLTHRPGGQNLVLPLLFWILSRVFLHQP